MACGAHGRSGLHVAPPVTREQVYDAGPVLGQHTVVRTATDDNKKRCSVTKTTAQVRYTTKYMRSDVSDIYK